MSTARFDAAEALRTSLDRREVVLLCALAVAGGALVGLLSSLLLPILAALALAWLIVVPMRSVHSRVSGYFVAGAVLFGLLLAYASYHFQSGVRRPVQVEIAALAVGVLFAVRAHRRPLPLVLLATPLLLALVDVAAFVNIGLHSSTSGFSAAVLANGLQRYLWYFLLAIFVYYSAFDEREMRGLLTMMGALFLVLAALAIVQSTTGRLFGPFLPTGYTVVMRSGFLRAQGILARPNDFAVFLGLWFFLFVCRAGRSGRALFYSVVCAAIGVSILLSLTRAVILGMALVAFLLVLRRISPRARLTACTMLVVLAMLLSLTSIGGVARHASASLSSSWRYYYLVQGLRVWEHNPLVGVGFYRYATNDSTGASPVLAQYNILPKPIQTTDAFLANILPEFGLLGAGVVLVAFLVLLQEGVRRGRVDRTADGYVGALLVGVVSMFTSSGALFAPESVALWISIAMLARYLHASRLTTDVSDGTRAV